MATAIRLGLLRDYWLPNGDKETIEIIHRGTRKLVDRLQ
jgi:hypothetical protein